MPSNAREMFLSPINRWIAILCLLAAVFLAVYSATISSNEWSSPDLMLSARRYTYVAIFIASSFLIFVERRNLMEIIPSPIIAMFLWFALSVLWSEDRFISISRLFAVGSSTVACFLCFHVLREKAFQTIYYFLVFCLAVNVLAVFATPNIGVTSLTIETAEHSLRGIFSEKNQAGAVTGITILVALFQIGRSNKIEKYIVTLVASVFLFFTRSNTALIMTIFSLPVGAFLLFFSKVTRPKTPMQFKGALTVSFLPLILFSLFIGLLTYLKTPLLEFFDDPTAFTNRGFIWRPLVAYYIDYPVTGSGYGGYWSTAASQSPTGGQTWLQGVTQGHNGYLDILAQTGLPGLALALGTVLSWPLFSYLRSSTRLSYNHALPLSVLVFCLGSNFTESGLYTRDVVWSFFIVAALCQFSIAQRASERSLRRRRRRSV